MALELQISLSFQNEGQSLLIEDITGTSSQAGSTKWSVGGLNTNFEQSDVSEVLLHVFVANSTEPKSVQATGLPQSGFSLLPAQIALGEDTFPDAIYAVRYIPLFTSFNNNVTAVQGDKNITVNSLDKTIITSRKITLLSLAGILYEVDLVATLAANSTTVVLKTKFQEPNAVILPANIRVGYFTNAYILNDRATVNCITKLMGSIKPNTSCCKSCKGSFINHFNDLNVARFNFNIGLYQNAQEALDFVRRNCQLSDKPCGCK